MSFSFTATGKDKAAAKAAVAAELDKVVGHQPIHARDRAAVQATADTFIDMLADDDTKDIRVSCNGYLSWNGSGTFDPATAPLCGTSVGFQAGHVARSE